MKIYKKKDTYIIYLNQLIVKKMNLNNNEISEKSFKKILKVLKNNYKIIVYGYTNISIFKDKYYGYILEINENDDNYYNRCDDLVLMKIKKYNKNFLYRITNIEMLKSFTKDVNIFTDCNNIYISLKRKLKNNDYLNLLENSEIIYNNDLHLVKIM